MPAPSAPKARSGGGRGEDHDVRPRAAEPAARSSGRVQEVRPELVDNQRAGAVRGGEEHAARRASKTWKAGPPVSTPGKLYTVTPARAKRRRRPGPYGRDSGGVPSRPRHELLRAPFGLVTITQLVGSGLHRPAADSVDAYQRADQYLVAELGNPLMRGAPRVTAAPSSRGSDFHELAREGHGIVVAAALSIQRPFSSATSASSTSPSWYAATGARQPPPSSGPTHARSATTRRRVSASSTAATVSSSPSRTWSASAPGRLREHCRRLETVADLSFQPQPVEAAGGEDDCVGARSDNLRRRVSMFPRRGLYRQRRLEREQLGASACRPRCQRASPEPNRSLPTSASRASSRGGYEPTTSRGVSVEVMSLAEWTATSIRPSKQKLHRPSRRRPARRLSRMAGGGPRSPVVVIA